jgi:hypothetical protein
MIPPLKRLMAARERVAAAEQELQRARQDEHGAHLAMVAAECAAVADTMRPPPATTPDLDGGWL